MHRCLFVLFLVAVCSISYAQKKDKKLEQEITEAIKGFNGKVGIYCINLKNNKTVSINADTIFPTASMVKIPILIGIMNKINKGELDYHQELLYRDSLLYPGVDILGSFRDTSKIELVLIGHLSFLFYYIRTLLQYRSNNQVIVLWRYHHLE